MITLYDLIAIILTLAGIMCGVGIIKDFGVWWGIVAVIAGGLIGRWLGILPKRLMIRNARRQLAKLTVDELRQQLYKPLYSDPKCWTPNFLLLELRARGEDIMQHIDLVLNMMEDESNLRRTFGYAALLSAYPHFANMIRGYNPSWKVEDCKKKITELRKEIKQITSGNEWFGSDASRSRKF
jgi:hypothetical protein